MFYLYQEAAILSQVMTVYSFNKLLIISITILPLRIWGSFFFLRIEVHRTAPQLHLSQTKYINDLLHKVI